MINPQYVVDKSHITIQEMAYQQRKGLQIACVFGGRHGPASGDLTLRKSAMLKNKILLHNWKKTIMYSPPSVPKTLIPEHTINMW